MGPADEKCVQQARPVGLLVESQSDHIEYMIESAHMSEAGIHVVCCINGKRKKREALYHRVPVVAGL